MLKQLYGIDLPEDVKGMEAVGLIHDKVAGQADAYGKTTAGAQDKLKNAIENAQEALEKNSRQSLYNRWINN